MPAIGKEGMERLKDSADAKEWQDAVKGLLSQEINERASARMEESRQYMDVVHSAIDMFTRNKDLIPGTKEFDRALADEFAKAAQPYEVRANGKLSGYSIPVQPLIDTIRDKLRATSQAAGTVPATQQESPGTAAPPAADQRAADPPQAGIPSKAGASSEREDFSVLFGTIGLPHLQI